MESVPFLWTIFLGRGVVPPVLLGSLSQIKTPFEMRGPPSRNTLTTFPPKGLMKKKRVFFSPLLGHPPSWGGEDPISLLGQTQLFFKFVVNLFPPLFSPFPLWGFPFPSKWNSGSFWSRLWQFPFLFLFYNQTPFSKDKFFPRENLTFLLMVSPPPFPFLFPSPKKKRNPPFKGPAIRGFLTIFGCTRGFFCPPSRGCVPFQTRGFFQIQPNNLSFSLFPASPFREGPTGKDSSHFFLPPTVFLYTGSTPLFQYQGFVVGGTKYFYLSSPFLVGFFSDISFFRVGPLIKKGSFS